MDTSLVAIVPLAEVVDDFLAYLRLECNLGELAGALPVGYMAQELEHIAKGAVNRSHVNMHEHMARTRDIFKSFSKDTTEQADDLADELYILLRAELPQQLGKDKSIYTVRRDGTTLYINLLASKDAWQYGIDPQSIIDQVL